MKVNKAKETQHHLAELRKCLSYDKKSGVFVSTNEKSRRHYGKPAGTLTANGYVRIGARIDGVLCFYLAHRLAWAFVVGSWPENMIDHKDTVKTNNSFDNLRDVTRSINAYNYPRITNANSSGYRGVHIDAIGKTVCYGAYYGKKRLGTFPTAELAHEAYLEYTKTIHEVISG